MRENFFAIAHGTTRTTVLVGPFAFKVGRGREGRLCNIRERQRWSVATPERRAMLCPTWAVLFYGGIAIQPRAMPMTEFDAQHRRDTWTFPDWGYVPGEAHGDPTEAKASDWGYLPGQQDPVALDYGVPDEWC